MYQALYRKWRPRIFEDVSGQPYVTKTLKNELIAGHVGHAYLFTGSRGTGKTTCAKILAKAVNCLHPKDGNPCNECEICKGIDNGSILDVEEIDAASNNGVDNIRELREMAAYTPAVAKYRVYIIDEAHMLSIGAFNALLKTLEEPPAYVIFILATTEAHKIPATILSRCQQFEFSRIPAGDIAKRLEFVASQENIRLTEGAADLIARLADGAMRDALSLLDRCAGENPEINEELVEKAAGLAGRDYLFAFSDAIRNRDTSAALKILDSLYSSSKDMERLCEELTVHFRNILLIRASPDSEELIRRSPDETAKLRDTAKDFTPESILYILDTLQSALDALRRSASRRVEMEMCLIRLCNPDFDPSNSAILRRVSELESRMKGGFDPVRPVSGDPENTDGQVRPKPLPRQEEHGETVSAPSREPANPPNPKEETSLPAQEEQRLDCWPEILENLASADPPLCGVLKGSSAVLRGEHVLVDSGNVMFGDLIRQQIHQKPLVEAVRKITGRPYKVGIFKRSLARSKSENDPMDEIVQKADLNGISIEETP